MKPSDRLIIVGGGNSIAEGIEKGLWKKISKEYTFGINSSINFHTPTVPVFCDWYFYKANKKELDKYPLVLGKFDGKIGNSDKHRCPEGNNLIMLKPNKAYQGAESWEKGFYSAILTGCFALTLGIALGFKEIYLLGFDFKEVNGKTHFYQKDSLDKQKVGKIIDNHGHVRCGIGKDERGNFRTGCYNKSPSLHFNEFKKIKEGIQVYNVSLESKIKVFPKISYNQFFKSLEETPRVVLQHKASLEINELVETFMRSFE